MAKSKATKAQAIVTRRRAPRLVVRPRPTPRRTKDFFSVLQRVVENAFNRPLLIVTLTLSVAFVASYKSLDEGIIAKLLPKTSKNEFVLWARANVVKFLGGILFLPVLVDVPPRYRLISVFGLAAWVYLVPESSYIEYAVQAVAFHLFMHLRAPRHRLYIFAAVLVAYFLGFLVPNPSPSPAPTTPKPKI